MCIGTLVTTDGGKTWTKIGTCIRIRTSLNLREESLHLREELKENDGAYIDGFFRIGSCELMIPYSLLVNKYHNILIVRQDVTKRNRILK